MYQRRFSCHPWLSTAIAAFMTWRLGMDEARLLYTHVTPPAPQVLYTTVHARTRAAMLESVCIIPWVICLTCSATHNILRDACVTSGLPSVASSLRAVTTRTRIHDHSATAKTNTCFLKPLLFRADGVRTILLKRGMDLPSRARAHWLEA